MISNRKKSFHREKKKLFICLCSCYVKKAWERFSFNIIDGKKIEESIQMGITSLVSEEYQVIPLKLYNKKVPPLIRCKYRKSLLCQVLQRQNYNTPAAYKKTQRKKLKRTGEKMFVIVNSYYDLLCVLFKLNFFAT